MLWAPAALCLRAKQSACTDDGDAVRITTKQGREDRFFARYSGNANTRNPTRSLSETSAPPHEHNPSRGYDPLSTDHVLSTHHTFYSHPCSLRSLAGLQSVLTTCSCSREDRRSPRPYSARPACPPRGRSCRATPQGRGRASSQESGCSPVPWSPWLEPAASAGGPTPQGRERRR